MARFSRRQKVILTLLMAINLSLAICNNTQGPLFPRLAESKGVKASQYGLVFGIYQLSRFLSALVYGYIIKKTGTRNMLTFGAFTVSLFFMLFGSLCYVNDSLEFFILCIIVRIVEGAGFAALVTALFTIVVQEFPSFVGAIMSLIETVFGIGLVIGPILGTTLYQVGGYVLPFLLIGSILMVCSIINFFALPTVDITVDLRSDVGIFTLLKLPEISIAMYSTMAAANNIGFIQTALEPHLRVFELSPSVVGFIFVLPGGCYGLFTILVGKLCDAGIAPRFLTTVGGTISVVAYLLMGPAPFIKVEPSLWLLCLALILHGIGIAGELVPSFVSSRRAALDKGLPDNISIVGLLSGLYGSMISFGAFLGPVITGLLIDNFGIRYSTLYNLALHSFVVILNLAFMCYKRKRPSDEDHTSDLNLNEKSNLLRSETN